MRDRVDVQHSQRPRPLLPRVHPLRRTWGRRGDGVGHSRPAGPCLLQRGRHSRPAAAAVLGRRRRHLDPGARGGVQDHGTPPHQTVRELRGDLQARTGGERQPPVGAPRAGQAQQGQGLADLVGDRAPPVPGHRPPAARDRSAPLRRQRLSLQIAHHRDEWPVHDRPAPGSRSGTAGGHRRPDARGSRFRARLRQQAGPLPPAQRTTAQRRDPLRPAREYEAPRDTADPPAGCGGVSRRDPRSRRR